MAGSLAMMHAVDAIVPLSEVTHTAIKHGNWSDPGIWTGGIVPSRGAKVLIDASVVYDLDVTTRISWIRISQNGSLLFADSKNTTLYVETIVGDGRSVIGCGTASSPLSPDFRCEIVFIDEGDLNPRVDKELIARGLVTLGSSRFYGAAKTTFEMVSVHPKRGSTSVTFSVAPTGWKLGDRILIGGTRYEGARWNGKNVEVQPVQDEERVITAIDGTVVTFDRGLSHDHSVDQLLSSGTTWTLHTHVMNLDRNIVMRSENTVDRHRRGHTMFMHNPDTDLRYVQFEELGRTEKRHEWSGEGGAYDLNRALLPFEFDGTDPATNPALTPASNVKGRYAMHLHNTGVSSLDWADQSFIIGCAVNGSPGWGYAQHNSNALFYLNTFCRVSGSGMISEVGNERGLWKQNCGMSCQAEEVKTAKLSENINQNWDLGRNGDAFRNMSRQVRMIGNVAQSSNGAFAWFHRGRNDDTDGSGLDGKIPLEATNLDVPDLFGYLETNISINSHPILHVADNIAIACNFGTIVEKANEQQHSDIRSVFLNSICYNCINSGIAWHYTSHYSAIGGVIRGFHDNVPNQTTSSFGLSTSGTAFDMAWINIHVENVQHVFNVDNRFTRETLYNHGQTNRAHMQSGVTSSRIRTSFAKVEDPKKRGGFSEPVPTDVTPLLDEPFAITLHGPETYAEGFNHYTYQGGRFHYGFSKSDSMGFTYEQSAAESFHLNRDAMAGFLKTLGFWTEANGDAWLMVPLYFGDRGTGEQHKIIEPVKLDVNLSSGPFKGARHNGQIDFTAGPDLDALEISGLPFPPLNGRIVKAENGKYRFYPDPGFSGLEPLTYWLTDSKDYMQRVIFEIDATQVAFPDFVEVDLPLEAALPDD